uniref:Zgc:158432 n=1 Tax=Cyprinus carpio TaxID=7962 RepID=A0A8C1N751_CYPCA
MKVLLYVCFILFILYVCSSVCNGVDDFDECLNEVANCDVKISRCTCFNGQPFCRCNSQKGEFYIDEECSQKWTVVTFALVASLPGLTLAVLVGVVVYVMMLSSNKSHTGEEVMTPKTASKEQDLFPGISFGSDMNGRPPPNMRPVQQGHIPMTAMPNHPGMRDPQMGGPARPYSMYTGMRDPPMGGPSPCFVFHILVFKSVVFVLHLRDCSNGAVRGQIVSNPYARDSPSRNPYEEHSPSADHHSDYRPRAPSNTYDELKHNQPYSPAPLYGSSEHGNLRNGFPRPQLSLRY